MTRRTWIGLSWLGCLLLTTSTGCAVAPLLAVPAFGAAGYVLGKRLKQGDVVVPTDAKVHQQLGEVKEVRPDGKVLVLWNDSAPMWMEANTLRVVPAPQPRAAAAR